MIYTEIKNGDLWIVGYQDLLGEWLVKGAALTYEEARYNFKEEMERRKLAKSIGMKYEKGVWKNK